MNDILFALKMAYRKHVLDDDSIGWDELSDIIKEGLCNQMGDEKFILWVEDINTKGQYRDT